MLPLKPAVLALATLAAVLTGGCDRRAQETAQPGADASNAKAPRAEATGTLDRGMAGTPLPALAVTDASGKSLDFATLKGKPVLLNLWATWCAPCVAELPALDALAARSGESLRVVAVSQDMQTGKVAGFLEERGVRHLAPWLDEKADLSFRLGAATLPMTVLYDAQGREVWRFSGANDWAGKQAEVLVAEAGAGQTHSR